VREGLPDAPILESLVLQVEPEVRIAVGRVVILVVVLLEGRVVRLALVLDGRELGHVHALGLELEKDGRLAGNDAVDDAADVGPSLDVVVLVRHQHDLLAALPLVEPVRPGAHGLQVLGRLAELALLDGLLEQVPG